MGIERFPKVLVGTPTYDGKEYCREEFVKVVQNLDYPNYRWLIVDNSAKPSYYHKLRRQHPTNVARVSRGKNSRDALANASNYLRKKVLEEGYEYLLMLESDIFPPPDVIWRLLQHGKSVVGAPYQIGFGNNKRLCIFVTEYKPEMGMAGTRIVTVEEERHFINNGVQQIHGMGVGCVLIHRSILERFAFWYSTADDDRMVLSDVRKHPDVYFYMDLHNAHIPVFIDTDIVCRHENSDWKLVKDI